MGRELKRVALDFDWPRKKIWEGCGRRGCGRRGCGCRGRIPAMSGGWLGDPESTPCEMGGGPVVEYPKDAPKDDAPALRVLALSRRLLKAASSALKSYQYGNSSPELAKETSEAIDKFLGE